MNHEEKPSQPKTNAARHSDPLLTTARHQLEENFEALNIYNNWDAELNQRIENIFQ